ncbi:hypothetical protein CHS0354_010443 [Potamilus streckersoni]|uniref:Uncharacterized protein n=1 Tax=Potamilus streckersoni TaxID=2493646 RepID=A0AAE0W0F6_9BIVA|nr:hypothetical protein CHS0354_010443 [Potamilus streckersoni]
MESYYESRCNTKVVAAVNQKRAIINLSTGYVNCVHGSKAYGHRRGGLTLSPQQKKILLRRIFFHDIMVLKEDISFLERHVQRAFPVKISTARKLVRKKIVDNSGKTVTLI